MNSDTWVVRPDCHQRGLAICPGVGTRIVYDARMRLVGNNHGLSASLRTRENAARLLFPTIAKNVTTKCFVAKSDALHVSRAH
jgi:hypothetical protein